MATPTPQPSRTRFEWTRANVLLVILVTLGVIMSVAAIVIASRQPAETDDTQDRMHELGVQWAAGYVEAMKASPAQSVLNSLYGACVVYTDSQIVPKYGQVASGAWLNGCLSYTREQQALVPTSSVPTPTT